MHNSVVKAGFDLGAFSALAAWWVGIVPALATTLTVIWISFCIVESSYTYYKKFRNRK